jgi:hypothetical protein
LLEKFGWVTQVTQPNQKRLPYVILSGAKNISAFFIALRLAQEIKFQES